MIERKRKKTQEKQPQKRYFQQNRSIVWECCCSATNKEWKSKFLTTSPHGISRRPPAEPASVGGTNALPPRLVVGSRAWVGLHIGPKNVSEYNATHKVDRSEVLASKLVNAITLGDYSSPPRRKYLWTLTIKFKRYLVLASTARTKWVFSVQWLSFPPYLHLAFALAIHLHSSVQCYSM